MSYEVHGFLVDDRRDAIKLMCDNLCRAFGQNDVETALEAVQDESIVEELIEMGCDRLNVVGFDTEEPVSRDEIKQALRKLEKEYTEETRHLFDDYEELDSEQYAAL